MMQIQKLGDQNTLAQTIKKNKLIQKRLYMENN